MPRVRKIRFTLIAIAVLLSAEAHAVESPTSAGPVSVVDTPIFRIPKSAKPPVVDGVMEDGEWEDASAVSGFWYDFTQNDFRFIAPIETQLQVYATYDDEHLYIAYTSPVYPEASWLRARGRFPRVQHHPLYGILWDDHIEFELRPYHDPSMGFQMGLFKWVINPTAVMDDTFWSIQTGWDRSLPAATRSASGVTRDRWVLEFSIPFEYFAHGAYAGGTQDGTPFVSIPPADGTAYLIWLVRAIGGNGPFFNAYDNHAWNTTKTRLIFDSRCVGFQINELGPIMEDIIDVQLTLKNHNSRSEAVRLGFFVENADGLVYSSYEDGQTSDGILELIPGEVRRLRLRKAFPGITQHGNTLWFDVRTAGTPAKIIYQTRLINFHSQDAMFGTPENPVTFKQRRLDVIETLRPPRKDFEVDNRFWSYTNTLATVIDRGAYGASDNAQAATEARIAVIDPGTQQEIATNIVPFNKAFAVSKFELPPLEDGKDYSISVLLFDRDKRIVGEDTGDTINKWGLPDWIFQRPNEAERRAGATYTPIEEWYNHDLGLDDVVWEPFVPIEETGNGFATLKHEFTLEPTGMPAQIFIKPHERKLPLELRANGAQPTDQQLIEVGRGPQLRAPMRLEAVVDGERVTAQVVEPATLVRRWNSEFEYHSKLKVGPVDVDLVMRYDCDGSIHATLNYGSQQPAVIEALELLADVAGNVDTAVFAMSGGGMTGGDRWECSLPPYEGIVWDSGAVQRPPLYYSHFVPWFFFGSGDRGFSWFSDTDEAWGLDKHGSGMTLERNANGEVTWRVKFVNHSFDVQGERTIKFTILVHPAKPKPDDYRRIAWYFTGETGRGYQIEAVDLSEEYLKRDWYWAAKAPRNIPWEEAPNFRREEPPWNRYGRWRNAGVTRVHTISPALDRIFEDRATYLLERHIRVGRRHGSWWDEYWPIGFSKSLDISAGYAYIRNPETVEEDELPYQAGYTTTHLRNTHKRLARFSAANNVPQRQFNWSNDQTNMLESVAWDSWLVEECGSDHRSLDVDVVTQFPVSLYRYMSKQFLGIVPRVVPGAVSAAPGGDKRLDRQYLGLALLNDIGASPSGPHGNYRHVEQSIRLLNILDDFGFFDDNDIEFVPYWRIQDAVRYGGGRKRHVPLVDLRVREPDEQVYISVYRRPIEVDGRKGYKALFVIMNCFREDVQSDLYVLNPARIFGGPNTFSRADAFSQYGSEFSKADALLQRWNGDAANRAVLIDLENLSIIEMTAGGEGDGETYAAVHVPRHNYRILYGHFLE